MGLRIEAPRQDGNARFNTLKVALTESSSITRHVVADGNGQFFYVNGGGGGGGTPGGSSGQIQYNNAGSFGGVPTIVYDTSLHVTGSFKGSLDGNAATATYATTAGSATTATSANTATTASYAITSSLALTNIITASANNTTITFTKGDGSQFNVTVSQSGSVSTASYALFAASAATASFVATASWALNAVTASYINAANVDGLSLFQIVTGSISASVGIDPTSMFLIKSGSTKYLNISSSGNVDIYSNLFIVKNFTTQQPVLIVSQSIVQIQTQSAIPTGTTNAGSIWFTSASMYIGLE